MEKIHQPYFSVYKKESSLLLKETKIFTPATKIVSTLFDKEPKKQLKNILSCLNM